MTTDQPVDLDQLCFIDCETTGLDPKIHVPWEIAVITWAEGGWEERSWALELTATERGAASPMALSVGGYYERGRNSAGQKGRDWVLNADRAELAEELAVTIGGRHLVANNPSFDARFVGDFMLRHNWPPTWHYHLVDTEVMVAARLLWAPPWKSTELSEAIGVEVPERHHTALDDARWAKDMFFAALTPELIVTGEIRRG